MALLRWITGFIAALAITAFAVTNRQYVDVHWSPFHNPLHLPLYLVSLGLMALGFFAGSSVVWLNTIPLRFSARRQKKKIETLEKKLDTVHTGELEDLPQSSAPLLRIK